MAVQSWRCCCFVVLCLLGTVSVTHARSMTSKSCGSKSKAPKGELLSLLDPLEASNSQDGVSLMDDATLSFSRKAAMYAQAPYASASLLGSGYDCTTTCNGKSFDTNSSEASCWGKFHWFCKSGNHARGSVVGVRCEGHYTLYSDWDDGKVLAVCEGLLKYFNVRKTNCSAGVTVVKYIAAGCLGTGSSKMSDAPSTRAAAAKTLADMAAYAHGATVAPFSAGKDGVLLLGESGARGSVDGGLIGTHSIGRVESEHGFAYEGKCGGLGGEMKGVKTWTKADDIDINDVDWLEATVESSLADLGVPSKLASFGLMSSLVADHSEEVQIPEAKGKAPPLEAPDNSLIQALLPAVESKIDLGDGRHLTCNLTCNGEEPWLEGALPCWGKLKLHCEGRQNDKEDSMKPLSKKAAEAALKEAKKAKEAEIKRKDAAKKERAARRDEEKKAREAEKKLHPQRETAPSDLPLSRIAYAALHNRKAMVGDAAVAAVQQQRVLAAVQRAGFAAGLERTVLSDSGVAFEFDAVCKGFWTGWFGKRCYGLTETHGLFSSEQREVESWGICTGKHGISGKRGKDGFAMGAWCKGHSAKGVVMEPRSTSSAAPYVIDHHLDERPMHGAVKGKATGLATASQQQQGAVQAAIGDAVQADMAADANVQTNMAASSQVQALPAVVVDDAAQDAESAVAQQDEVAAAADVSESSVEAISDAATQTDTVENAGSEVTTNP